MITKGAVIVETRNLYNLVEIIENHMKYLPDDWGLTIFHSSLNEQVLKNNFIGVKFVNLLVDTIDNMHYNKLLTSVSFWEEVPYDKVLVFQSDSMLLRKGVEDFLEWDYVGGPWKFQIHGGNGGLSLRSKKAMIDVINSVDYDKSIHGNEDVYYSNFIEGVAPREVCEKFSCETIFKLGTLGYHAIDKWLTEEECSQIKTQYG